MNPRITTFIQKLCPYGFAIKTLKENVSRSLGLRVTKDTRSNNLRVVALNMIQGNNGVLEGSNPVTPLQNVMGKKKGSMDQGNRVGKPNHVAEKPNQPLSTFGNAEKPIFPEAPSSFISSIPSLQDQPLPPPTLPLKEKLVPPLLLKVKKSSYRRSPLLAIMCYPIIKAYDEIREFCFSLHPSKAPGPYGFKVYFFKKTWDIIGEDVINAIQEFFRSGHLLKELNTTILALVPKVPNPSKMKDFRPISCYNTLYKIITKIIAKIIANRIKPCLPYIVSPSQSAFVVGRSIGDNILLVQELMRSYHKDIGCPRLALKVDLMKDFDMVDWSFLLETLAAFHFAPKIITWIKACLTTPKFSISINGELGGFFSGKRGIWQGDLMSPYLFVIDMEVLSKILTKRITDSTSFKYHWWCDKIKLSHLFFVDDLIMLFHGSPSSALVLKAALDKLSLLSGLLANQAKSNIFTLGFRYLGILIISTKLCIRDCSPLVDKVSGRLTSWMNRGLSYAGRLQLIISVLSSLQVFWASYLCLSIKILKIIEHKF
ncbi:hypothetical protein Ddye_008107 [Dipteronia dyeriana]|uniref:Reverse transcriptase domain-containing protein n=1 Tax=Dipteronia dyeriana TaxID=168575 RepID=A0AAD9X962_9ROSI|nr:hypothetical protein Ddye_008107 [Dipteronia dyeriana]